MKKVDLSLPSFSKCHLERMTFDGARSIFGEKLYEEVEDRLKFELEVIEKKGLTDYFLIVQDYINITRQPYDVITFPMNCKVSGSLVAYCLGITYLNPLKYDLMFEVFVQLDDDSIPSICIGADDETAYYMKSEMKKRYGVEHITGLSIQTNGLITKLIKVYDHIKDIHSKWFNLRKEPLDDSYTLELFKHGMTDYLGLFSTESRRNSLLSLNKVTFKDIAHLHALFNHEVCDDLRLFIDRRVYQVVVRYDIPTMERYLSETYGILLFKEQMMLLSRLIADFTREESYELLRRRSDRLKNLFIKGGQKNGHNTKVLVKIWAEWKRKGPYLMSKSQAFDYAFLVYQIAYLRAHYPIEFQMEFPWNSEYRLRIF